jgi:hypothetical protein
MVLGRHVALACTCLALSCASAPADECTDRGQRLYARLEQAPTSAEPRGFVRTVLREATATLDDCRNDAAAWYVFLRSAELVAEFPLRIGDVEIKDLRAATDLGLQRAPRSVRVATVRARAWNTVDAAREAVALDPAYVPAQVALGSALMDHDPAAARAVLERVPDLDRVPGGFVLLARSRLLMGDLSGAIDAAGKERSTMLRTVEPSILPDAMAVRDAREVAGRAFLAQGNYPRASASLLDAAVRGSEPARRIIGDAHGEFRAALTRLLNKPNLDQGSRDVLRGLLERRANDSL